MTRERGRRAERESEREEKRVEERARGVMEREEKGGRDRSSGFCSRPRSRGDVEHPIVAERDERLRELGSLRCAHASASAVPAGSEFATRAEIDLLAEEPLASVR